MWLVELRHHGPCKWEHQVKSSPTHTYTSTVNITYKNVCHHSSAFHSGPSSTNESHRGRPLCSGVFFHWYPPPMVGWQKDGSTFLLGVARASLTVLGGHSWWSTACGSVMQECTPARWLMMLGWTQGVCNWKWEVREWEVMNAFNTNLLTLYRHAAISM